MKRPRWIAEARRPEELDELKRAGADGVVVFAEPFGHPFATGLALMEIRELRLRAAQRGLDVFAYIDGIVVDRDVETIADKLARLAALSLTGILCFDETVGLIARSRDLSIPVIYAPGSLLTNAKEANFYGRQGFAGVVAASDLSVAAAARLAEHASVPVGYSLGNVALYRSKRKLITENGVHASASSTYRLNEEKRPGRWFPIQEDDSGTMILRDRAVAIPPGVVWENLPFDWLFVWRGAMDNASFLSFLQQEREGRQ